MDATTKMRMDAPGLDGLAPTAVVSADAPPGLPARDDDVAALASYVEYGGPLPRWAASTLDGLALTPLFYLVEQLPSLAPGAVAPLAMLLMALACGYEIFCTGRWGRTLGKWAVGLEVRMEDGDAPTWKAAWLRSAVPLVLYVALGAFGGTSMDQPGALPVLLVMMAWWLADFVALAVSEKYRSLHDLMAGTVVIRGN
jgi:uncharacterized RDD family membrane protein YckC